MADNPKTKVLVISNKTEDTEDTNNNLNTNINSLINNSLGSNIDINTENYIEQTLCYSSKLKFIEIFSNIEEKYDFIIMKTNCGIKFFDKDHFAIIWKILKNDGILIICKEEYELLELKQIQVLNNDNEFLVKYFNNIEKYFIKNPNFTYDEIASEMKILQIQKEDTDEIKKGLLIKNKNLLQNNKFKIAKITIPEYNFFSEDFKNKFTKTLILLDFIDITGTVILACINVTYNAPDNAPDNALDDKMNKEIEYINQNFINEFPYITKPTNNNDFTIDFILIELTKHILEIINIEIIDIKSKKGGKYIRQNKNKHTQKIKKKKTKRRTQVISI